MQTLQNGLGMEPHSHGAVPGERPQCPQGPGTMVVLTGTKEGHSQPREAFPAGGRRRAGLGSSARHHRLLPGCTVSPLTCLAQAPGGSRCSARPRGEAEAAPRSPPHPGKLGCWKTWGNRASGVGETGTGSHRKKGLLWDRGAKVGMSQPWRAQGQEQLKEGREFPAMQRSEQVALGELRRLLAVASGTWKMPGLTQSGLLQQLKHQNPSQKGRAVP